MSDSDSSSSDSEEEEINCLMADDTEVSDLSQYDFLYEEFEKEELLKALTDMASKYEKLVKKYKTKQVIEVKEVFENIETKQHINDLKEENVKLKETVKDLTETLKHLNFENKRLDYIVKSWTKSSETLNNMQTEQKPVGCRTGLGFDKSNESKPFCPMNGKRKLVRLTKGITDTDLKIQMLMKEDLKYIGPTGLRENWLKEKSKTTDWSKIDRSSRKPVLNGKRPYY